MIRKATIADIKAIYSLLQIYGKSGELLARPLSRLYDHVRDFSVFVDKTSDTVVACCALQFCWENLAEIRSLAVHPDYVRQNIGSQLVQNALEEAKTFQIKQLFVLTYKPDFLKNSNFRLLTELNSP